MTTLTQTQPVIQFWELYEHGDIIRGQTCPHIPFWKAKNHFEVVYEFRCEKAHYIIATQDASISKSAALEWCKDHYAGLMVTRTVDMTKLTPTQPTIRFYEVWEYANWLRGRCITEWPFYKASQLFEVVYEFRGQSAHYIICSNDASITRGMALDWAKVHHAGGFRTFTVDLSPCQPPIKK